jgi:hypothetical protein
LSPTFPELNNKEQLNVKFGSIIRRLQKLYSLIEDEHKEKFVKHVDSVIFGSLYGMHQQSDVIDQEGETTEIESGNIEFIDASTVAPFASIKPNLRVVYDKSDMMLDLGKWFSRPLLIDTYTALLADAVMTNHQVNPWYTFFTNTENNNKLTNFPFFRCNLHIKVVISGTPFIYGKEGVFYAPLQNDLASPNTNFGTGVKSGLSNQQMCLLSQLPHLFITPHDSKGGEMTLPYINNQNWIVTADSTSGSATNLKNLGALMYTRWVQFQSANGATSNGITINTFCWATEFETAGTTTGLTWQSDSGGKRKTRRKKKDEYTGPISGPASAVSALAGLFTNAPIIGEFATATQMGADAVAMGASLLGFTNVPVIEDIRSFRPVVVPPLSSSEIGFGFEKLALDPKNELTIDGSAVGFNNMDELNIQHLVTKPAFLGALSWGQSSGEGIILGGLVVAPNQMVQVDGTQYTPHVMVFPSPLAYFGEMFAAWRGDIILDIDIVASKYHKGRLALIWDPAGTSTTNLINTDKFNVVKREIIDIGETKSISIRIPYLQATEWLNNNALATSQGLKSGTPSFAHVPGADNGTFIIRVINELSAPVTSATANILVYARAAENFEFANPRILDQTIGAGGSFGGLSLLVPQSDDMTVLQFDNPSRPKEERFLTNYGEAYVSLRPLLHRMSYVGTNSSALTQAKVNAITYLMGPMPAPYGYDANGQSSALSITGGAASNFNFTMMHPMTWVAAAFLARRGGSNWLFNPICNSAQGTFPINDLTISRLPFPQTTPFTGVVASAPTDNSAWASYYRIYQYNGNAGTSFTDTRVQPTLAITAPDYNRYFFHGTSPLSATSFSQTDGSDYNVLSLKYTVDLTDVSTTNVVTHLTMFAGAGVDWTVHGFLHCPPVYIYNSYPTAN